MLYIIYRERERERTRLMTGRHWSTVLFGYVLRVVFEAQITSLAWSNSFTRNGCSWSLWDMECLG